MGRRARHGLTLLVGVTILLLGAGCSDKQTNKEATPPSSTQRVARATETRHPATGEPLRSGTPYAFTANEFRYSLALHVLEPTPETATSSGQASRFVAPPGKTFLAFGALLTNLQQDRRAPFPGWANGPAVFASDGRPVIAVPTAKVPKQDRDRGDFDCSLRDRPGLCAYSGTYTCVRQIGVNHTEIIPVSAFLSPGERVYIGCITLTAVRQLQPSEIRLYYSAKGGSHEFDLPAP